MYTHTYVYIRIYTYKYISGTFISRSGGSTFEGCPLFAECHKAKNWTI